MEDAAKASAKGTQEPLPSEPVKPVVRRRVVSDITIEALRNVLENVDSGVLCVHDELASFFGGMDAYRGNTAIPKDRGDWLAAFNGGKHSVDRVGKRYCIRNWSVGIVGFIQPEPMRKIAKKITDDGLLVRFLVFSGSGAEVGKTFQSIKRRTMLTRPLFELWQIWFQKGMRFRVFSRLKR